MAASKPDPVYAAWLTGVAIGGALNGVFIGVIANWGLSWATGWIGWVLRVGVLALAVYRLRTMGPIVRPGPVPKRDARPFFSTLEVLVAGTLILLPPLLQLHAPFVTLLSLPTVLVVAGAKALNLNWPPWVGNLANLVQLGAAAAALFAFLRSRTARPGASSNRR